MEILIDSANLAQISYYNDLLPIDGITTNPSILAKETADYFTLLKQLKDLLAPEQSLHIQVVSIGVEQIINEAIMINQFRKNTYAKIPATSAGLKAIKYLKEKGYLVTATAVYSTIQGVLVAKMGVDYIAPYVNRLDNMGYDGIAIVADLVKIIQQEQYTSKVVAASFKNVQQVLNMMKVNTPALTIAPEVLKQMCQQSLTAEAVVNFSRDWQTRYQADHLALHD